MRPDTDDGFAGGQSLPDPVSAICKRCGTTNTLLLVDTPLLKRVTCSHCGADLGTVADLSTPAKPSPGGLS